MKLHVLIPTRATISVETLRWLVGQYTKPDLVAPCCHIVDRMTQSDARNELIAQVRAEPKTDDEWVLWCDDDALPDPGDLFQLFRAAQDLPPKSLVSGYASMRMTGQRGFLNRADTNQLYHVGVDFVEGEVLRVPFIGFHFLLHRREAIEESDPVQCRPNARDLDDVFFCYDLGRKGYGVYVHTGVQIGHVDVRDGKVYYPNLKPEPVPLGETGLHLNSYIKPANLVCAYITCGMPELHKSMADQLFGMKVVAFDNGGDPPATPLEGVAVLRSSTNLYWGGGFNALMRQVIDLWSDVVAVWVCNDDITGVGPIMARDLFELLLTSAAAAVSPAIKGSQATPNQKQGDKPREVPFTDFCAPMIWVPAWRAVGKLDLDLGTGWGLDIDWCYRARQLGYKILVDDRNVINHEHPAQTTEAKGTVSDHEQYGAERFYLKHGIEMSQATVF